MCFCVASATGVSAVVPLSESPATMSQSQEVVNQNVKVLHVFSFEGLSFSLVT